MPTFAQAPISLRHSFLDINLLHVIHFQNMYFEEKLAPWLNTG